MNSEITKCLLVVLMTLAGPLAAAGLKAQLESLAEEYAFELSGEMALDGAPAVPARGDIGGRINRMLSGFNHVVIRSSKGEVTRVLVLGPKRSMPPPPDQIIVNTRRLGSHHTLTATLIGESGAEVQRRLIVDTGSTFVVLPRSLVEKLDIDPASLTTRELQTVAGSVTAQLGNLHALRIGGTELRDVATAFIADADLGGNLLLGMSLLDRFQVTFDDQQERLILVFRK